MLEVAVPVEAPGVGTPLDWSPTGTTTGVVSKAGLRSSGDKDSLGFSSLLLSLDFSAFIVPVGATKVPAGVG
jgi:hypothetical protein